VDVLKCEMWQANFRARWTQGTVAGQLGVSDQDPTWWKRCPEVYREKRRPASKR
jgi:hypothetical protein